MPSDHIDIILDVLEEKPIISESLNTSSPITATNKTGTMSSTIKNSCIPITTSSINTSPAIPPKPSYLSNAIYSTLPNRSSHLVTIVPYVYNLLLLLLLYLLPQ